MGVKEKVASLTKRVQDRLALHGLPVYTLKTLKEVATNTAFLQKIRRSLVEQTYIETVDKIVEQPWPYKLLKAYANRHPFLRIVHAARIREAVRNRWDVKPRFAKKCVTCGQEFQEAVEECPDCKEKGFLRDPNPQEKKRLETFLKDPNRDDEMIDIIISLYKDSLAVDDWYLSIVKVAPNQYAIYVEDASEMFICADKHARIGNGVWFCPECWGIRNDKTYKTLGNCPDCGGELKETAYVQKQAGNIKARFSKEEIIHGNSEPWLPKLYGNSKVVAVLTELRTALAMSSSQFRTYSKGHISKIIGLKGEEQTKAEEIASSAKTQTEKITIDSFTGRIGREPATNLFIGTREGLDVFDAMPDSEKMQSLEWMEFWMVKIVGGIYGVQPIMMNAPTRGPGGYFQRMQIVVQNDATEEMQKSFEDPFNEQFVQAVMKICDWMFKFNEIEPRNEMEEAQIWQVKVAAGTAAVQAGLNAEITDEGELKISGEFKEPKIPSGATGYIHELPKPPKPPQPKMPQPFSQEKIKKGKTWLVTEVEPSNMENSDNKSGSSG